MDIHIDITCACYTPTCVVTCTHKLLDPHTNRDRPPLPSQQGHRGWEMCYAYAGSPSMIPGILFGAATLGLIPFGGQHHAEVAKVIQQLQGPVLGDGEGLFFLQRRPQCQGREERRKVLLGICPLVWATSQLFGSSSFFTPARTFQR